MLTQKDSVVKANQLSIKWTVEKYIQSPCHKHLLLPLHCFFCMWAFPSNFISCIAFHEKKILKVLH